MQAVILCEEIIATGFFRKAKALIIEKLFHALGEYFLAGQCFQIGIGDGILRLHPFGDFRIDAHIVFQPAIGISNLHTKLLINDIDGFGLRIGQFDCDIGGG